MSAPVYKNRTRKNFGIDNELTKILENYSKETFIPESRIIDMALKEYFEKHNIK